MPVISTAYTVSSGQTDSGNIIVGGGIESIVSGGKTIGTSITSGGVEIVSGGGIASGTIVSSGGVEYIRLGGTLAGAALSGGLIEIMSGGTAGTSEIDFAASAGGTLQLDDSRHFSGIISGFGVPGAIDLRDISFGTARRWATPTAEAAAR
jgi:autotransporter passenger strand-loop-strand repeat protein